MQCFLEARAVPRNPGVFLFARGNFFGARKHILDDRDCFPDSKVLYQVTGRFHCVQGLFPVLQEVFHARERLLGAWDCFLVTIRHVLGTK